MQVDLTIEMGIDLGQPRGRRCAAGRAPGVSTPLPWKPSPAAEPTQGPGAETLEVPR